MKFEICVNEIQFYRFRVEPLTLSEQIFYHKNYKNSFTHISNFIHTYLKFPSHISQISCNNMGHILLQKVHPLPSEMSKTDRKSVLQLLLLPKKIKSHSKDLNIKKFDLENVRALASLKVGPELI